MNAELAAALERLVLSREGVVRFKISIHDIFRKAMHQAFEP